VDDPSAAYLVPAPGEKNIFTPPPRKTVEFEVKNRRQSSEKAKAEHLQLLLMLFFDSINRV